MTQPTGPFLRMPSSTSDASRNSVLTRRLAWPALTLAALLSVWIVWVAVTSYTSDEPLAIIGLMLAAAAAAPLVIAVLLVFAGLARSTRTSGVTLAGIGLGIIAIELLFWLYLFSFGF